MGDDENEDYISKFFEGAKKEILDDESLTDFQKHVAVFSLSLKEHQRRDPEYWLELIHYTENLRKRGNYPSFDCYGVDFAIHTVEKINKINPSLKVTCTDVQNLPFEDNFFSGYWSL